MLFDRRRRVLLRLVLDARRTNIAHEDLAHSRGSAQRAATQRRASIVTFGLCEPLLSPGVRRGRVVHVSPSGEPCRRGLVDCSDVGHPSLGAI